MVHFRKTWFSSSFKCLFTETRNCSEISVLTAPEIPLCFTTQFFRWWWDCTLISSTSLGFPLSESPPTPLFCTQASVSWGSAFDGSLGYSGGTLSTFLLWPKLLASSGLLTHCGGPVYPRVFLWAWCSGAGFCNLLCFAHLKQIFQLSGPALSLPHDHAVDSVKGLWERTGRLMRTHIVTGAFQNSTP